MEQLVTPVTKVARTGATMLNLFMPKNQTFQTKSCGLIMNTKYYTFILNLLLNTT